jgi:predicted RNase H-like HicB family nuclease
MRMKFKVVVHPEPEGGFWGEIPALPGCYSQGETMPELMENLREAALGYLEVMREEGGQPLPEIEVTELAL